MLCTVYKFLGSSCSVWSRYHLWLPSSVPPLTVKAHHRCPKDPSLISQRHTITLLKIRCQPIPLLYNPFIDKPLP
jgi:hypothetical protein